MSESVNFVDVKDQFIFEIDDITLEAEVSSSNQLTGNFVMHKKYFKASSGLKEESEGSDIEKEDRPSESKQ